MSNNSWELIETAPKDGSYILLWGPSWNRPQLGCWWDEEVFEHGISKRKIQRWMTASIFSVYGGDKEHGFTHWHFIPKPPKT